MKFDIHTDSRLFIMGESKSGKSYLIKKLLSNLTRVIYIDPSGDELATLPRSWQGIQVMDEAGIIDTLRKAKKEGNVHIVIDDYDLYASSRLSDDPEWRYLFIAARHRNIGWTTITRRLADIPKLALKQCDYAFFFQTDLAQDLQTVREQIGDSAAETIRNLDRSRHQFMYWDRTNKKTGVMIA